MWMPKIMINYKTNHKDALELSIENKVIIITSFPSEIIGKEIMIFLQTSRLSEINKKHCIANGIVYYNVDSIPPGIYSLNIYVGKTISGEYVGYYTNNNIMIDIDLFTVRIVEPIAFLDNSMKLQCVFDNVYSSKLQCISIDEKIMTIAKQITQGVVVNYLKAKAIHDWVANNVFYDKDSLNYDFYIYRDHSPLITLSTLKGVCQGYANLTDALLSSLGFKSIIVPCFALTQSTMGKWNNTDNTICKANHVMNAVYIDCRWILMDVTWDSHNSYEKGIRRSRDIMNYTHQYFDPTLFFISNTHKFL